MYALNRGPSKFVTSTRRGGTKKIDNFEGRDLTKRSGVAGPALNMSSPMPVFNGKRSNAGRVPSMNSGVSDEPVSPQHDENVHFLSNMWYKVQTDLEKARGTVRYREKTSNPELDSFKPFDLEEWWGRRTLQKITESS